MMKKDSVEPAVNWFIGFQNVMLLLGGGLCIWIGLTLHHRGQERDAARAEVVILKQEAEASQRRLKDDLVGCLKERRDALTMYDDADKSRNQCEAALFVCRDRLAVYEETSGR